jgi:hypothetical protein
LSPVKLILSFLKQVMDPPEGKRYLLRLWQQQQQQHSQVHAWMTNLRIATRDCSEMVTRW